MSLSMLSPGLMRTSLVNSTPVTKNPPKEKTCSAKTPPRKKQILTPTVQMRLLQRRPQKMQKLLPLTHNHSPKRRLHSLQSKPRPDPTQSPPPSSEPATKTSAPSFSPPPLPVRNPARACPPPPLSLSCPINAPSKKPSPPLSSRSPRR